jgi:penicillin-binding protein 2
VRAQFEDRQTLAVRVALLRYAVIAAFVMLVGAFWYLQVIQHAVFEEMAENNHLRTVELRAPRGVIFDREGRVLVENRYVFNILVDREQVKSLDETLAMLARLTGIPEATLHQTVERQRRTPIYRPVVVIEDASMPQLSAIAARKLEMPAVRIEQVPTRYYRENQLAAHLLGYVGEVSDAQLARPDHAGAQPGDLVGQSGVELAYNTRLMGRSGARHVVVNSIGREIREVGELAPTEGQRLQLTIDLDLQRAIEEGFSETGFWGSAVVLDPRNGEVLAFTSLPAYDPNEFAAGIERATWTALNTDPLKPLQNRAIQGRYSPGSVFKIVVAVAALEEGIVTPSFRVFCPGGAVFYGRFFKCHQASGHGSVDLETAIEKSCNTYFYTIGNMVGIDRLHKWATALGLGVKSGVPLPNEVEGLMPSTEWKRRVHGEKWYAGETISVSIGQGQVSVTPISLAVMMASVASGTRRTPRLLKAVETPNGWEPVAVQAPAEPIQLKPVTIQALHQGLWRVVNGAGTGGRARIPGRDVAGKTGTAQVISNQGRLAARGSGKDLRDHGFFVFFAPRDNPELAGLVFAEHSEHGFLAAPIAKFMIETYFAKKEGQPLPVWPGPGVAQPVVAAGGPAGQH